MPATQEARTSRREIIQPRWGLIDEIFESGKYKFATFKERSIEGLPLDFRGEIDKALLERFPGIYVLTFREASLSSGDDSREYSPAAIQMTPGLEPQYRYGNNYLVGEDNVTRKLPKRHDGSIGGWELEYIDKGIPYIDKNMRREAPTERDGALILHLHNWSEETVRKWSLEVEFYGENPGKVIKEIVHSLNKIKEDNDLSLWRDYRPDLPY